MLRMTARACSGRAAAMLAGSRLPGAQLRVLAALPVDDKNDLADLLVNVSDDLRDQAAHQPLTRSHRRSRCLPRCRETIGKPRKIRLQIAGIGRLHGIELLLARFDAPKRGLPRLLQLCSN